jgi:putative redox protein
VVSLQSKEEALMKITTEYKGSMRFEHGEGPSLVVMDAKPEAGGLGQALAPKEMVLQGLAGCTGMDVAVMLAKKKIHFESFSIDIEALETSTHPKVFKTIKITYRLKAKPEDRPAIERMIDLSKNMFCGVGTMLAKTAEINWELELTPID